MQRKFSTLSLLFVFAFAIGLTPVTGCVGSQFQAIEESELTPEAQAKTKLHVVETSWVAAKQTLADVKVDLDALGIVVPDAIKVRVLQVVAGGNLALDRARAAINAGDISATGQLVSALATLRQATQSLVYQSTQLSALGGSR